MTLKRKIKVSLVHHFWITNDAKSVKNKMIQITDTGHCSGDLSLFDNFVVVVLFLFCFVFVFVFFFTHIEAFNSTTKLSWS